MSDAEAKAKEMKAAINQLRDSCHVASYTAGWWHNVTTEESQIGDPFVEATKICLIHSEVSEAMEGHRTNSMDDKLPERSAVECELADAVIRIMDLAGAMDLDIGGAIVEKMSFNAQRPDHKIVNRRKPGGKKY